MSTRSEKPSPSSGSSSWRRRLRRLQTELGDFAVRNLINLGAVVAVALLIAADSPTVRALGALAGLASLIGILVRRWSDFYPKPKTGLLGYFVSVRLLLVVAVGGIFLARPPRTPARRGGRRLGRRRDPVAAGDGRAPGQDAAEHHQDRRPQPARGAAGAEGAVLPRLDHAPATCWPSSSRPCWPRSLPRAGPCSVPALATVPLTLLTVRHALRATGASKRIERDTPAALRAYAPAFVVYYAATQGARYQLGMWLPYLERLDKPYVVITRNPATVGEIAAMTKKPILVPRTDKKMSDHLDSMVVPSMKAAFYVQGSPANSTFQRYPMTHVWLNHGDSDKQANYHPRHATYSKLFVSGQQGADRYAAHGIEVPPGRFEIVGRPQIESIKVRDEPLPPGTPRTVLYAPTWQGGRPSTNYSSLPNGLAMIKAMLERGSTVVFRPHPISYNDRDGRGPDQGHPRAAGRGPDGERAPARVGQDRPRRSGTSPACFNASDALITDVSSIASDYLASGKPFAMCAVLSSGEAFTAEFPMARVAYVIEPDLSTLDEALDHLHGDDPLAEKRLAYRAYCLGDNIGPHAADEFLRVAGALTS